MTKLQKADCRNLPLSFSLVIRPRGAGLFLMASPVGMISSLRRSSLLVSVPLRQPSTLNYPPSPTSLTQDVPSPGSRVSLHVRVRQRGPPGQAGRPGAHLCCAAPASPGSDSVLPPNHSLTPLGVCSLLAGLRRCRRCLLRPGRELARRLRDLHRHQLRHGVR